MYRVGYGCPEGFDFVSTGARGACAYRRHAGCLGGFTDASGHFVCTTLDFDCPPGMSTRLGSPPNWCFPDEPGAFATGLDVSQGFPWTPESWQSLGRQASEAWSSWQDAATAASPGVAHALPQSFSPFGTATELGRRLGKAVAAVPDYGKQALSEAAAAAAKSATASMPEMPDVEGAAKEASRGVKAAAAILGISVLGASLLLVLGRRPAA